MTVFSPTHIKTRSQIHATIYYIAKCSTARVYDADKNIHICVQFCLKLQVGGLVLTGEP